MIQVWSLYLILPFVSSSWVDWWVRRTFIKTSLISAGNMGIWEPKFYYQWSYLELVGVSLSFENLDFPCLKGLLWKCMPGSLEHTDWFFRFTVNLMFSLGMQVTGCGRGCCHSSATKNSQPCFCCFMAPVALWFLILFQKNTKYYFMVTLPSNLKQMR